MYQAILDGYVLAESEEIKRVQGVYYFPYKSVVSSYLRSANYVTPDEKGLAQYYDLVVNGETLKQSAWQYIQTKDAYQEMRNYVAFYGSVEVFAAQSDSVSKSTHKGSKSQRLDNLTEYWGPIIPELLIKSLIVAAVFTAGNLLFQFAAFNDYSTNVYTELLGIIATIFVWETIAKHRENTNQIILRQTALRLDAGSMSSSLAKRSIDVLRQERWLAGEDGILQEAELRDTNWTGINLSFANLRKSKLDRATIRNANLIHANMEYANLWKVDFSGSMLANANFSGAFLDDAKLVDCDLSDVNFCGTTLWGTDLTGANLENAQFDTDTLLPDNTYWYTEVDLARFTDSGHAEYFDVASVSRTVETLNVSV